MQSLQVTPCAGVQSLIFNCVPHQRQSRQGWKGQQSNIRVLYLLEKSFLGLHCAATLSLAARASSLLIRLMMTVCVRYCDASSSAACVRRRRQRAIWRQSTEPARYRSGRLRRRHRISFVPQQNGPARFLR